jgi:hydroxymethylpyrimidine pyrophosphatase-like HAD family hydrolase
MVLCKLLQKLLIYDTPESIKYKIRPYWASKIQGKATLVQALDDMLEILPPGQSKGAGVTLLLDHLGVAPEEVGLTLSSLISSPVYRPH